jgi:hypothetical protein
VAAAVRDREWLSRANANGQSAVRRLLHDDDLRDTEVIDGNQAGGGLLGGGHPRTISHERRAPRGTTGPIARVEAFRGAGPLEDPYPNLRLDANFEKVRRRRAGCTRARWYSRTPCTRPGAAR